MNPDNQREEDQSNDKRNQNGGIWYTVVYSVNGDGLEIALPNLVHGKQIPCAVCFAPGMHVTQETGTQVGRCTTLNSFV